VAAGRVPSHAVADGGGLNCGRGGLLKRRARSIWSASIARPRACGDRNPGIARVLRPVGTGPTARGVSVQRSVAWIEQGASNKGASNAEAVRR